MIRCLSPLERVPSRQVSFLWCYGKVSSYQQSYSAKKRKRPFLLVESQQKANIGLGYVKGKHRYHLDRSQLKGIRLSSVGESMFASVNYKFRHQAVRTNSERVSVIRTPSGKTRSSCQDKALRIRLIIL